MSSNGRVKIKKYWKDMEESNIVLIWGTVRSLSSSY